MQEIRWGAPAWQVGAMFKLQHYHKVKQGNKNVGGHFSAWILPSIPFLCFGLYYTFHSVLGWSFHRVHGHLVQASCQGSHATHRGRITVLLLLFIFLCRGYTPGPARPQAFRSGAVPSPGLTGSWSHRDFGAPSSRTVVFGGRVGQGLHFSSLLKMRPLGEHHV
jgi:hypothetical protein